MKAASQVPSGVLISTLSSATFKPAADAEPVAATRPAVADNATKSRRDRPSRPLLFRLRLFSSFMPFSSPLFPRTATCLIDRGRVHCFELYQRHGPLAGAASPQPGMRTAARLYRFSSA